jgi:hypothetical protein
LSEGVLKKVHVGSSHDASVVRVELYVDDLLVMGAAYGEGGG